MSLRILFLIALVLVVALETIVNVNGFMFTVVQQPYRQTRRVPYYIKQYQQDNNNILKKRRNNNHDGGISSSSSSRIMRTRTITLRSSSSSSSSSNNEIDNELKRRISAAADDDKNKELFSSIDNNNEESSATTTTINKSSAATNTVNERLMKELNDKMVSTSSSSSSSSEAIDKMGGLFNGGRVRTEEERQLALDEARDLNGVNPIVCFISSLICFALSYGLWESTSYITEYITNHPINDEQVYVVQRLTSVLRNVIIGMSSLGCGFSGVIGLGLLLLGGRTAYGVYITKELDPTPIINKNRQTMGGVNRGYDPNVAIEEFNPKDAFNLMMGNKKKQRNKTK